MKRERESVMTDQSKCILIQNGTLLSHDGARLSEMAGWLVVEGEQIERDGCWTGA